MNNLQKLGDAWFSNLERSVGDKADELLDGCGIVLQEFDTETLLAIAAYRDAICPDGWVQTMIREYVEVWR